MKLSSPNLDDENSSDKINQKWEKYFSLLSYRENLADTLWILGVLILFNQKYSSFSNVDQNGSSPFSNDIDSKGNYFNAKALIERKLFKISAIEQEWTEYNQRRNLGFHRSKKNMNLEMISSLFAETDLGISNDLSLKIGARAENSSSINLFGIFAKICHGYRISKEWTSSLAYGTFFQNPEK